MDWVKPRNTAGMRAIILNNFRKTHCILAGRHVNQILVGKA